MCYVLMGIFDPRNVYNDVRSMKGLTSYKNSELNFRNQSALKPFLHWPDCLLNTRKFQYTDSTARVRYPFVPLRFKLVYKHVRLSGTAGQCPLET
jgi:hypothetical protein